MALAAAHSRPASLALRRRLAPALAALALLLAPPALAQGPNGPTAEPPAPGAPAPEAGSWTLDGAVRVLSAYVNRGFVSEDDGVIVQPELGATYTFLDREGWSLGVLGGGFASIHSEATGADGARGVLEYVYETTGWLGLALDVGPLAIHPYYEASDSPANAATRAQELGVLVAWDDSGWHERLSLQPRLLFVRETEGAADGAGNGSYLGLGLEPTLALPTARLGDVRVWLPLELGLSLADYYEDERGHDETFGYASAGAFAAAPLPFLPADVQLELGVRHTWFGDTTREANGERGIWVGSLGLGFAF